MINLRHASLQIKLTYEIPKLQSFESNSNPEMLAKNDYGKIEFKFMFSLIQIYILRLTPTVRKRLKFPYILYVIHLNTIPNVRYIIYEMIPKIIWKF